MHLHGILVFAALIVLYSAVAAHASETTQQDWDVAADTWEAVDLLGRPVSTHAETGAPREDRTIGVFYFLWMGSHVNGGPWDVSKILAEHPEALQDKEHPAWGPMHAMHFWGEPLFGYYLSDDRWVLRKHAQMLADALVDVIIFDVTNRHTYKQYYQDLCEVFLEARSQCTREPKIAFLCTFCDPQDTVSELYRDLYEPGLYKELWFPWEGKPLIMANPDQVDDGVKDFFTFRKPIPSYFTGPDGPDQWGWLEVYPQHVYYNSRGEAEQMTVGVAQNAVDGRLGSLSEKHAQGRNFHGGRWDDRPKSAWYGLNVMEQWARALEEDPRFIFITGWNEWIAMRFDEFNGIREPVMFVDQFNHQNSRDIEPMQGGHWDTYYYQMVDYIRRYKGARPQPPAGPGQSIAIEGDFSQWDAVTPVYRNHRGSTAHRNHPGYADAGPYVNTTGRNDIVLCKVAHDAEKVYFYVETREPLTPACDPAWMRLFINTDGNPETGWEGFDRIVNRNAAGVVEQSRSGWDWEKAGEADWRMDGTRLHVAVSREDLGIKTEDKLDLRFKWSDNVQQDGDIMEFTVNGDAAPPGRFVYRYYEE